MNFDQWLAANGYDAAKLTEQQRKHLESSWKADTGALVAPPEAQKIAPAESFDQKMAAIEAENTRIETIRQMTLNACERNRGDIEKCKQLREMSATAIADQKTDVRTFELALLRQERSIGPMILVPKSEQQIDNQVLEAAVAMTVGIPQKHYSEPVLQAAHNRFRRGIGLKELLQYAGQRNNNYRGSLNDEQALCRAAFGQAENFGGMMADSGISSISVSGILSNVANKSLEEAWMYGEQAWRDVARIRPVRDFKTATQYRLSGGGKFKKVPPSGEIKHGTLDELTYSLKADTYGVMIGLSRTDIINDDLGAFASVSDEIGRGAIDSLNEVFWTDTWIASQSSYFPTSDANDNYISGATTPLSIAGLDLADTKLRIQTKPDGTPLGAMGAVLLTPASLSNTAAALMSSMTLVVGTTPASGPDANVFKGRYKPVSSAYLDGTSTIEWWLLADPRALAAIQIGFLNGVDRPTIQSSEFDFQRLGLSMRGYLDFGVSMMEYRAGVRSKGTS